MIIKRATIQEGWKSLPVWFYRHTLQGENYTLLTNDCTRLWNDCTRLTNDCTRLTNDCTRLTNDCTRLWNDCTRLTNDCTFFWKDYSFSGIGYSRYPFRNDQILSMKPLIPNPASLPFPFLYFLNFSFLFFYRTNSPILIWLFFLT
jgi:hypothetical protein